jgi:hypothetical protein
LVVMGDRDPDFKDQRGEAEWIASALHGEVMMVPNAGHYPQSQQPEITNAAVLRFLASLEHREVIGTPTPVVSVATSNGAAVGS